MGRISLKINKYLPVFILSFAFLLISFHSFGLGAFFQTDSSGNMVNCHSGGNVFCSMSFVEMLSKWQISTAAVMPLISLLLIFLSILLFKAEKSQNLNSELDYVSKVKLFENNTFKNFLLEAFSRGILNPKTY